jgi:hypothetical protein
MLIRFKDAMWRVLMAILLKILVFRDVMAVSFQSYIA